MKIAAFQNTMIDYPGKNSAIVFTAGCNYACPSCHAGGIVNPSSLVDEKKFWKYVDTRKGWLDGVVLCGGEPTVQPDLPLFLRNLKRRGLAVKLDTNGSNPKVVEQLLEEQLVDYAAMDIKGPRELYPRLVGSTIDIEDIEKSISLISSFPEHEYRTTVVPIFEKGRARFLNPEEVEKAARWVVEATGNSEHRYFVQKFIAQGKGEMVDGRFCKNELPKEMHKTPPELLEKMAERARKYLPQTRVR